jgi:hypothetical protein
MDEGRGREAQMAGVYVVSKEFLRRHIKTLTPLLSPEFLVYFPREHLFDILFSQETHLQRSSLSFGPNRTANDRCSINCPITGRTLGRDRTRDPG